MPGQPREPGGAAPGSRRSPVVPLRAAAADLPMLTFFHRPLPEEQRLALTIEAMELFRP